MVLLIFFQHAYLPIDCETEKNINLGRKSFNIK